MPHVESTPALAVVTTAETAIGSTGISAAPGTAQYVPAAIPAKIVGMVNITAGAGTTAIVIRCRQGTNTTTGVIVGAAQTDNLAATNLESLPFEFQDLVGSATGYTMTVQQTGATGNGTVNYVSFDVTNNG